MGRPVIRIITSIAVRSGMISTSFSRSRKARSIDQDNKFMFTSLPWSHPDGWDEIWHDSDFAVPPLPCHLVAGKHGILHALDWLLRRWRSQSVAYGISNSEASESFCLLQEKNPFLPLCAHKDAHEYLWRFNLFVLQFYPLYVGSCEGMTQGVIRDRIMGHHNTPLEV